MPIHDWTRVNAGIFHHFHHGWIFAIASVLNRGVLPTGYYALAEQIAGGLGPDVLALEAPRLSTPQKTGSEGTGGVALALAPPNVRFRARAESEQYAAKANAVVVRHVSGHDVVAMLEIVSPGNKSSRHGLRSFVDKAEEVLRAGVHLLVVDLFPPGSFDREGVHGAIWERFTDEPFSLPADKRLTLASYSGGPVQESFVEPVSVGSILPAMPLFLTPDVYVNVPLEAPYQSAWQEVPEFWRNVLSGGGAGPA